MSLRELHAMHKHSGTRERGPNDSRVGSACRIVFVALLCLAVVPKNSWGGSILLQAEKPLYAIPLNGEVDVAIHVANTTVNVLQWDFGIEVDSALATVDGENAVWSPRVLGTLGNGIWFYQESGSDRWKAALGFGGTIVLPAGFGEVVRLRVRGNVLGTGSLQLTNLGKLWVLEGTANVVTVDSQIVVFGPLGAVEISPNGGAYNTPQQVSLSAESSREIRYTVDGSDPGSDSTLFDGSLQIDAPDGGTVRLRVLAFSYDDSTTEAEATYTFDTTRPRILSFTTAHPDGAYPAGTTIPVTVALSEDVAATGPPAVLSFDSGGTAPLQLLTPGATATASYTVAPGENSEDLRAVALQLPQGALITDPAGNLLDPSIGIGIPNLGDVSDIVVDTSPPTVQLSPDLAQTSTPPVGFQALFSEPVSQPDSSFFTLVNGTVVPGSPASDDGGTTWGIQVTPDGGGVVSLGLLPGAAHDRAENPSLAGDAASSLFRVSEVSWVLSVGWNLLGSPADPSPRSPYELLVTPAGRPMASAVFLPDSARSTQPVPVDTAMASGLAYWVYCPIWAGKTRVFVAPPGSATTTLLPGWNAISPTCDTPVPTIDDRALPAWWWDPDARAYRQVGLGTLLRTGVGYWIFLHLDVPTVVTFCPDRR